MACVHGEPLPAAEGGRDCGQSLCDGGRGQLDGEPELDGASPDGESVDRIVKSKSFVMRPMSPEEAVLQMDLLGHDFFFFSNALTGRSGVVYRRRSGDIGLIDEAG